MKRLFCFVFVAALAGISGCSGQEKDPPKIIVTDPTKPTVTNSIGMKFVWIKPGSFMMGSPKKEKERQLSGTDETQHKVTLTKGFYMGVYTVTQEQWKEIMG